MSKIKKIEVFFLEYTFPKKLNYKYSAGVVENMIVPVIKLTDSNNNYGLGEITHGQFTHEPIIGLIKHFSNLLKNSNSENINQAWEKMYGSSVFWNREGLGIGVMGGINLAMYDLLGKRMEMPVYKLLGGIQKEKIRIYASNGLFDNSKQLLEDATKAYSLGFRVYKMRVISPDSIIDLVKSFNKKFKSKMQLIVDAVQGSAANPWATKVSINLAKKLEKEEIVFLEEPCRVENLKGYKDIKKFTFDTIGYSIDDLKISLIVDYDRISLVDKNLEERITIDMGLKVKNEFRSKNLNRLIIVELKQNRYNPRSNFIKALRKYKVYETRFSKYCIGLTQIDNSLKHNRFKPQLIKLDKILTHK